MTTRVAISKIIYEQPGKIDTYRPLRRTNPSAAYFFTLNKTLGLPDKQSLTCLGV